MDGKKKGGHQMQIAFQNRSKKLAERDAEFIVAACNLAMVDLAKAWGFEPWPCELYKSAAALPPKAIAGRMFILDDIGDPDALGFHDDQLGYVYGRVLAQGDATGPTADHESKEMRLDPDCNQWGKMPNGDETAKEASDAVEGDTDTKSVTIGGETRTIEVSNFLLPAWFDAKAEGPFDFLGKLLAPFTMTPGGYMIVRHPDGSTEDIFADHPSMRHAMARHDPARVVELARARRAAVAIKRADPTSRASRRHRIAELARTK